MFDEPVLASQQRGALTHGHVQYAQEFRVQLPWQQCIDMLVQCGLVGAEQRGLWLQGGAHHSASWILLHVWPAETLASSYLMTQAMVARRSLHL